MTKSLEADVVVVGGGPAGLAAATAAATAGLSVVLLDPYGALGGQYYMQPPMTSAALAQSWQARRGRTRIEQASAAGVKVLCGVEVWGVFPGFSVHAQDGDGAVRLEAPTLVVATGAHDRTIAFPGWTLPGVMTPGAAQRLAKTSGIAPGRRTLLAGSGPFLLPVAGAILRAGGELVEVVEAQPSIRRLLPLLVAFPEKWPEILRLLHPLATVRQRFRFGEVVVAAHGETHVEAAELAPLDANGRPLLKRKRLIADIDSLLVGYGFRPQIDLTAMLGCGHRFDEEAGGWHCEIDPQSGQTDVAGIFAAGEVCGIGGAVPAELSGRIAGLAAVERVSGSHTEAQRRGLLRRLRRARRFSDALNRYFAPPSGLSELLTDETVVCRCEDVTAGEIRAEIKNGIDEIQGAKLWTRVGMGPCQGRICAFTLARLLAAETGKPAADIGFNRPRIPLRPVPLNVVGESLREITE